LSPEQFETEFTTGRAMQSRGNPLIREFTPNLARFRWIDAYQQTRRALLTAAIAVQSDGPGMLAGYATRMTARHFLTCNSRVASA
jgi:hypothetical protein